MVVQRCGDRAQRVEVGWWSSVFSSGSVPAHHLEVHDVASVPSVFDGDHLPAVAGGEHGRGR